MAALDSGHYPPNSLEAIRACLEAAAPLIEIDATALASSDYLLVHDSVLQNETTGDGEVSAASPEQAKTLYLRHRGEPIPYHPALLSEVVAMFLQYGGQSRLQIDFKNVYPMPHEEPLRRLIALIEPLGSRVQVSTGADWHLRAMHRLAPWLDLGFDIGFYIDYRTQPADPRKPPFREGAYHYHDDHLLALQKLVPVQQYLTERCEILYRLVPEVSTWYVNYHLIAQCLQDGFTMASWLHDKGIKLGAWTLDADNASIHAQIASLKAAGVDQFTTNTPIALTQILKDSE
ncbi:MAG: glycerophosphodiester phosphodiesterase [Anaerolineae bacterium]